MKHTLETRKAKPDSFIDVWYKDTVVDPTVPAKAVYDFIGMDFTAEAKAEMEHWREVNKREDRPSHEYTLEQFGFSEEGLKQQFAEYRDHYLG